MMLLFRVFMRVKKCEFLRQQGNQNESSRVGVPRATYLVAYSHIGIDGAFLASQSSVQYVGEVL